MLIKASNKKINPLLIVSGLFILFLSLFTYLFFECQNWIGENAGKAITTANFFIAGAVLLAFDILFLIFSIKYFKINLRLPFLIVAVVGVIFGTITLLGFPGAIYNGEIVYIPSKTEILKGLFTTLLVFFSMYLYTVVVPQVTKGRKYFKLFFIIGACVGLYGIIHSYVFEGEIYKALFTDPHAYRGTPQSFTTNRNVYAFILVISMLCEAYLIVDDGGFWHWPLFFIFFLNVLFTFSKTAIIIAVIALVMFVVWMILKLREKHFIQATIIGTVTFVLALSLLIISTVEFDGILGYGHTFLNYLFKELPSFNEGAFESRIYWFNVAFEQLGRQPFTKFFGFGYSNWIPAFYASYSGDSTLYQPMDVAYAIDMLQMGYPGLLIALGLWIFVIYNIQMLFVRKSKYAFISLLFFVPIILRTVTEGGDLAYTNLSGIAYYLLLLCPMVSERKAYRVEEVLKENPVVLEKQRSVSMKVISAIVSSISTVIAAILLSMALVNKQDNQTMLIIWSIIVLLSGGTISILLYLFLSFKKENKKTKSVLSIVSLIVYLVALPLMFSGGEGTSALSITFAALSFFMSASVLFLKPKDSSKGNPSLEFILSVLTSLAIWGAGLAMLSFFAPSLDAMATLVVVFGTIISVLFINLLLKKEVFASLLPRKKKA